MTIPFRCGMNHISQIDPDADVTYLADLAGGWHLMGTCPVCNRRNAIPLTPVESADYLAAGIPVLEDSPRLRAILNTHAIHAHGHLGEFAINVWAGVLADLPDEDFCALVRAWTGQEAPHV